ncbi:MAG: hypothetical protein J6S21_05470, partial [Victivallales bacterium]|nr:hypothetical protein [Victivallales bacterium]
MSIIDWLVTLIPFSLILIMAVRSGRYVRGVADFLAAGRCAGRYVMCVGDLTAGLSVITLVAMVEANYQVGCALSFWNFFNVLAGIATTLTGYCVYRYRATRALSFGQFLEMRYNRTVRIVAAIIRNVAEMITNAIGPAIAAGFFVYFLGLSRYVNILGFQISTVGIIVAICLFLAMLCIWPGGRVSLLLTDCAQGIMTYPIFVIISVFILCKFSWFEEIAPVMMDRVDGESFLNPFDIENLREFNLFSTTVAVFGNILNRAAWFGNDTTNSGRTPHEQKMAGILGYWRNGFSYIMMTLVALMIITYMNHKDFSQDSYEVRNALSANVTEELIPDRELQEKINTTIAAIPPHTHTIGVDAPLSQASNLDTPYYDTFRNLLTELPEDHELYEQRFKLSQRYRSTYNQMMTPVVLRKLFPVGLGGLFCLLMLMLLISTDDSRIFNASSTLVQDCIMPFVKKPWTTKQHIMWLRLASVAVALFFFVVAIFFQNLDF